MNTHHTNENLTGLDKLITNAEFNRFSVISVVLLVVGCLGGLNVGLGGLNSTFQLIATVIPTMATLSFILAIAPMRLLLGTAILATIIDVIFIIINVV
ncbi:MAG: hypothetical protein ACLGGV_05345 [Bacteroidia bacterium]